MNFSPYFAQTLKYCTWNYGVMWNKSQWAVDKTVNIALNNRLFMHVESCAELLIFYVISVYKKNDGADDSTLELAAGFYLIFTHGNVGRDEQLQQLEICNWHVPCAWESVRLYRYNHHQYQDTGTRAKIL